MKILVIEDEPEMLFNLVSILRLERFEPIAARNGRAGLAAARQERPAWAGPLSMPFDDVA